MSRVPAAQRDVRAQRRAFGPELARVGLGAFVAFAGLAHLSFAREEFRAQVPHWFPVDADLVIVTSGVVELVLGLAFIALPRNRGLLALLLALFFVAIFPGNIAQYVEGTPAFGLTSNAARLARLFFQPILIALALWAGGLLSRWTRVGPSKPRVGSRT
ncbi:MAG: hypothetical protein Q4P36_07925 [Bowdeniella nasicola]|nr:hypothetical protein [Bowdeniella nasicola]